MNHNNIIIIIIIIIFEFRNSVNKNILQSSDGFVNRQYAFFWNFDLNSEGVFQYGSLVGKRERNYNSLL